MPSQQEKNRRVTSTPEEFGRRKFRTEEEKKFRGSEPSAPARVQKLQKDRLQGNANRQSDEKQRRSENQSAASAGNEHDSRASLPPFRPSAPPLTIIENQTHHWEGGSEYEYRPPARLPTPTPLTKKSRGSESSGRARAQKLNTQIQKDRLQGKANQQSDENQTHLVENQTRPSENQSAASEHDPRASFPPFRPSAPPEPIIENQTHHWEKGSEQEHHPRATRPSSLTHDGGRIYSWAPWDPHGDVVGRFATKATCRDGDGDYCATVERVGPQVLDLGTDLRNYFDATATGPVSDDFFDAGRREICWKLGGLLNSLTAQSTVQGCAAYVRQIPDAAAGRYLTTRGTRAMYWLRPVLLFLLCFFTQCVLLRVTTWQYVRYMDKVEALMKGLPPTASVPSQDGVESSFAADFWEQVLSDVYFGVDPANSTIGWTKKLPLWLLDLSGVVPVVMFVVSYGVCGPLVLGYQNIGLWTKTLLVASVMALLKGVCNVVTTIPDASGWENCKERLGSDVDLIREFGAAEGSLSFFSVVLNQLWVQFYVAVNDHRATRFCGDTLVSGHTYFAVLFSLSTYVQVKTVLPASGGGLVRTFCRGLLRALVGLVCVLCVVCEILAVSASRFHYTVDIVLSVVFVLCLWSCINIETTASAWTEGYYWRDPRWQRNSLAASVLGSWWKRASCGEKADEEYSVVPWRSKNLMHASHRDFFHRQDDKESVDEDLARGVNRPSLRSANVRRGACSEQSSRWSTVASVGTPNAARYCKQGALC